MARGFNAHSRNTMNHQSHRWLGVLALAWGAGSANTSCASANEGNNGATSGRGGSAGATAGTALNSIGRIDAAIGIISTERAKYGAAMNRLDVTVSSIQTMRVNLSAANSRIRDVDVAEETSQLARNQVLAQAGTSMLAQANQLPQMAMQLLQG